MNINFHFIIPLIAILSTLCLKQSLEGRWETKPSATGNITGVVFKTDFTYTAYVNRKTFATGVYKFQDSLLSIRENGCEYTGTYKTIFFASDSLKLQPVADSCTERVKGISRLVLGRTK